eukprot:113651-Amphidinium_carterae.1
MHIHAYTYIHADINIHIEVLVSLISCSSSDATHPHFSPLSDSGVAEETYYDGNLKSQSRAVESL